MTTPVCPTFQSANKDLIATFDGAIVVFVTPEQTMGELAHHANGLCHDALGRFVKSEAFGKMSAGEVAKLRFPAGLAASALAVVKLDRDMDANAARKSGGALGKVLGSDAVLVLGDGQPALMPVLHGLSLRRYTFDDHKSEKADAAGDVSVMVTDPKGATSDYAVLDAIAQGVYFTRDLVNEPSNILGTIEFADRLLALGDLGLKVRVFEESDLADLGMHAFLGVGLGSETPTKMVVMEWRGGGDEAPLALVGKGVVFDTGGISLKPAAGMEDMTMDMGGAGVVAGVMKTLALRKARANVVGLVGLVENMPDGKAQVPGDVVTSMKGDTIEVINTDAEGRLVLCDVLWFAQQEYKPRGVIDLATLTGAIIIGLGHVNAGVFSNSDEFTGKFLSAAEAEAEGAWRMPLDPAYDKLLKSRIADMKNVGGRAAGSVTAAQFLQRFIKADTDWIHLDIAGVASVKSATDLAPEGATGWGVRALNRLVADEYEG